MSQLRRRALLSVSDKSGVEDFARGLVERGFEILSTGGTARFLEEAGVPVTPVSDVTGHPEILGGRVKTLHPAIHGPLLARRGDSSHLDALEELGYGLIDVVAVNLYAFRQTVAAGSVPVDQAMEQVDIGGPTMIRAAAKNHDHVMVVTDPADYPRVLHALDPDGPRGDAPGTSPPLGADALRRELAVKVFRHISEYDSAVAAYLEAEVVSDPASEEEGQEAGGLPDLLTGGWQRQNVLRYGENPDQQAAFYVRSGAAPAGVASLHQHHGKALSYNNLLDLDGALLSLSPFALSPHPAVCIVKHTTPCGMAVGDTLEAAYRRALSTDPMSAFGSIIAMNRGVDEPTAHALSELFVECVVAPHVEPEAMEVLTRKKNIRILTFPDAAEGELEASGVRSKALDAFDLEVEDPHARRAARFLAGLGHRPDPWAMRGISGGVLVQAPPMPPFFGVADPDWTVVTARRPTDSERTDLAFAWAAVFGVKSNAILLARVGQTLGIGAGQTSRVDASKVAVRKAGEAGLELVGASLASDAFFPFRDGVDAAAEAGVTAIIQPGGSLRDQEVIEAANEHDMAMILTGRRLFRH